VLHQTSRWISGSLLLRAEEEGERKGGGEEEKVKGEKGGKGRVSLLHFMASLQLAAAGDVGGRYTAWGRG